MVSSYVGALATMTGFELEPAPAAVARATCSAPSWPASWPPTATPTSIALVLDSELEVEGEACSLSFMLLPTPAGVAELLHRIGLGD